MNIDRFKRLTVVSVAAAMTSWGITETALAGNTWTGASTTTSNWSDNANWGGAAPAYGTLLFSGTTRTTNTDDTITSMNQINFNASSGPWTINQGGTNVLKLFDNGGTQPKVENHGSTLVTINLPITFASNNASPPNPFGEINAVNADLTFNGALVVNGISVNGIKLYSNGHTVNMNGTVTATGKYIAMLATNTLSIGGSFTSGDIYDMNGGTVSLASAGSITTTALRLGGDYGTTGGQNQALGGTFNLAATAGGQTFANLIDTVSGNTSGALVINAKNTSGIDTLSGNLFLDASLAINSTSGGSLLLGAAASTNTISFQSSASHVLTIGGAGNTTLNESVGNVTNGTDQLITTGTGTVTLAADNSASGANLLLFNDVSGTLAISAASNLGSPVVSGTGYPDKVLFGATTITSAPVLQVNGTFSYGSAASGNILGFAINKTSATTGNTAVINVTGSNVFTMNGAISDNGTGTTGTLQTGGTGTLVLAASSAYSGGTNISGGTLAVTNASALGTGNVTSSSTLDVGYGSPLALNLSSSSYTQGSGGTLKLQINDSSSGNYSVLQTTGAAALNGTLNMNVGSGGGPAANDTRFQVLNTGTRTGVFTGYTTNIGSGKAFDTSLIEKTGQLSVVNYFNGFENVNGTWANNSSTFGGSVNSYVLGGSTTPGGATQVVNAAAASSNSAYGKLTPTAYTLPALGGPFPATANVGPATHFNGDSASFGTGFTTQADIFIDPSWTGDANGTGFDYSSAVSDNTGAYHRDFILHTYKAGGTMYVSADCNSDYTADPAALTTDVNHAAITSAGWYTVQDTFYNNAGTLAVDIKLFNSAGAAVLDQTLSSTSDAISGIGGNNYAWFINIDTGTGSSNYLNVDNVKLINNTGAGISGPAAVTAGITLLGNAAITGSIANFDIGGIHPGAVTNGYDYLNVTNGVATLSGDLNVDFVDGFEDVITAADQFTVFQANSVTGAFDNVTDGSRLETTDDSGSFLANYITTNGTTSLVLSDFQAGSVPEPSSLSLLALGAASLLRRRRRSNCV